MPGQRLKKTGPGYSGAGDGAKHEYFAGTERNGVLATTTGWVRLLSTRGIYRGGKHSADVLGTDLRLLQAVPEGNPGLAQRVEKVIPDLKLESESR